mmetsp:Transcript_23088/g.65053  ORF Transcript_23088/g.65053 Transcript_23088/m.65053 type:complete len:507 (-) Transcript_23088:108-1628(-)
MSEYFRRLVKRDPPPAALIRFRCAKLHRASAPGADTSVSEYNTIYDVLRARGWKETDVDTEWHIFWADKDWIHGMFDKIHLDPHQHVNHFLNHQELCRKDLLVKNMKRMRRQLEKEGRGDEANKYNVYPVTFVVPMEYNMFVEEFKKHLGSTWIMKPVGRSQGAGIFLVNKLAQLQQWRTAHNWKPPKDGKDVDDDAEVKEGPEIYVVQKYLDDPLLVGGKKFDIRLYVLVVSYQPLTIYMHRGGFCRFSMSRYSNDLSNMKDLGSHLTNVAVQKNSGKAAYKRTGAKWDMHRFKSYIVNVAGVETANSMMEDIESIVIHSLLSVQKVMINDKHCFELYGYDILIDIHYKPWLLEVNASPSLTANTTADYDMKYGLLDDTMSLLDFEKYLTGSELQIGGFDLLYRDGLRYAPPEGSVNASYLGCANNRGRQLERLAKVRAMDFASGNASALAAAAAAVVPGPGDKRASVVAAPALPVCLWEASGLERAPRTVRVFPTPAPPPPAAK